MLLRVHEAGAVWVDVERGIRARDRGGWSAVGAARGRVVLGAFYRPDDPPILSTSFTTSPRW